LSLRSIAQIVLLGLQLMSWLTRRVDQKEWEAAGYAAAVDAQMAELKRNLGRADAAAKEAQAATPEDRAKSLGSEL
jgi:hypothetical protein